MSPPTWWRTQHARTVTEGGKRGREPAPARSRLLGAARRPRLAPVPPEHHDARDGPGRVHLRGMWGLDAPPRPRGLVVAAEARDLEPGRGAVSGVPGARVMATKPRYASPETCLICARLGELCLPPGGGGGRAAVGRGGGG